MTKTEHAETRRKRRGRRRKGILWDFNGDGRFAVELVKGYWKRYWRRWQRRQV